jgi:hypothetical protein
MLQFHTGNQFTDKAKEFKATCSILDSMRSNRRFAAKKLDKTGGR